MSFSRRTQTVVVGAGFTGLAAAYELARQGLDVTVLEAESEVGGLASAFDVNGGKLERFYHHWFTHDRDIMRLVAELGLSARLQINPTRTGLYFARRFFNLSTPGDLLRFSPLGPVDRLRLGFLALRARRVKNWRVLENQTAQEWLRSLGGEKVYKIVWEPLLRGKFGPYAERVSAVWFWNKLKLRGGSRGRGGEERLVYFTGGFSALAEALVKTIRGMRGKVKLQTRVSSLEPFGRRWRVVTARKTFTADHVIATQAPALTAGMVREWADPGYLAGLTRIPYLANLCLVLVLDRPLSGMYWLNVNEPGFPFVGVIEHTNFEHPKTYGGGHIVYLSRYLPQADPMFSFDSVQYLDYALPYLQKMFPALERKWIKAHYLWRAAWAQPVVERNYGQSLRALDSPYPGLHLCSMAQIYPEDRGTNYAIRAGRELGARLAGQIKGPKIENRLISEV